MDLIIGIDPGSSGAVAFYWPATRRLEVFDTPNMKKAVGTKERTVIDVFGLIQTLMPASPSVVGASHAVIAYVEEVGPMPRDGKVQAFAFGKSYGEVLAILACLEIPVVSIRPAAWKKTMKLSSDKNYSRSAITSLFPSLIDLFKRVRDADRAEAALLAIYGAKKQGFIHE